MDIPIIYECATYIVINKPPGIVVNRAQSVKGETVQDWVEKVHPSLFTLQNEENKEFNDRCGTVHRLDKETSGILLIAKTPAAFAQLQRQFKERLVHKTYLALAHGLVTPTEGEIRAPVARLPWQRERFGIVPGGKDAITKYKVIKSLNNYNLYNTNDDYSVLELTPLTGRTHQIRVHLKYINHPIVGDFLYAGRKTSRADRIWALRVMLHAWKITFFDPDSGQPVDYVAPVPDDMNRLIS